VKIVTEDNDVVYFCLYPIYVLGIRIRSRTGKSLNEQKLKFQGIFINFRLLFHEAMRVQLNGCVNVLLMAKDHRRMFDLQLQSATTAFSSSSAARRLAGKTVLSSFQLFCRACRESSSTGRRAAASLTNGRRVDVCDDDKSV